jgi:hypothetical protein
MQPDPSRRAVASAAAGAVITSARALSNSALITRVRELAGEEQQITAGLVAHLAVLDERQLYLVEGCSSMFVYLTQVLHFSEHAAYGRIQAARAARRYPLILDLLAEGSVNLTTITLVAPDLTARTHHEVLEALRHKSRRQVEEFLARLRPNPSVRPLIRRLPTPPLSIARPHTADVVPEPPEGPPLPSPSPLPEPSTSSAPPPGPTALFPSGDEPLPGAPPVSAGRDASTQPPPGVMPLAAAYYRVQFTASEETHAKLRAAQDLLRHQIPDGDVGRILDRALSALLIELARRKVGAAGPRAERPSAGESGGAGPSRYIPVEVRRTVWMRDGGRCAFVATGGRRCAERGFLEFHHIVPFSAGGPATVDNLELRCRAHNGYEAARSLDEPAMPPAEEDREPIDGGDLRVPPSRGPT